MNRSQFIYHLFKIRIYDGCRLRKCVRLTFLFERTIPENEPAQRRHLDNTTRKYLSTIHRYLFTISCVPGAHVKARRRPFFSTSSGSGRHSINLLPSQLRIQIERALLSTLKWIMPQCRSATDRDTDDVIICFRCCYICIIFSDTAIG